MTIRVWYDYDSRGLHCPGDNVAQDSNDDFLMDAEITLSDLEGSANPILERVKKRLISEKGGPDAHMAHPSHSSSSGRGHNSYVSGRFEDQPPAAEEER